MGKRIPLLRQLEKGSCLFTHESVASERRFYFGLGEKLGWEEQVAGGWILFDRISQPQCEEDPSFLPFSLAPVSALSICSPVIPFDVRGGK